MVPKDKGELDPAPPATAADGSELYTDLYIADTFALAGRDDDKGEFALPPIVSSPSRALLEAGRVPAPGPRLRGKVLE